MEELMRQVLSELKDLKTGMDSRFDKVDSKLEKVESRLDNIESDVKLLKKDTKEIKHNINYIWEDIKRMDDRLVDQEKKVEKLAK